MASKLLCLLFPLWTVIVAISGGSINPSSRIKNGIPVDTLSRFPWHVSIRTLEGPIKCSGTIIHRRWVLTSKGCVAQNTLYELSFQRLYSDRFDGSFSVTVDRSSVVDYPTGYDNLALIKLPISLELTNFLAIAKLAAIQEIDNRLVVMPGFGNATTELSYGMFKLLPLKECESTYRDKFDEYLQLCTKSWGYVGQVPCSNNEGGGLIADWPANPTLAGIFTNADKNCDGMSPAVYTNLRTYIDWINDVLRYL